MREGLLAALLVLGCFPPAARATTLIVPDQAATIQAALDAPVDTVLVRPGAYPETLAVVRAVTMLGLAEAPADRPVVEGGMRIVTDNGGTQRFRGIRFEDRSISDGYPSSVDLEFADCEVGLSDARALGSIRALSVRRCRLIGPLSLPSASRVSIDSCDVVGSVMASGEDHAMTVRNCTIQGGGISSSHYQSDCTVENNVIRGGGFGISIDGREVIVINNRIEDAQYAGLDASGEGTTTVSNNVVLRCGSGLFARGERLTVDHNLVEDCPFGIQASSGPTTLTNNTVRRCGTGIRVDAAEAAVIGNVVVQAGTQGLRVDHAATLEVTGNVFAMCVAEGMRLNATAATRTYVKVRQNTSCYNGLSGFASASYQLGQEWVGNIGYGNQEYGINWLKIDAATIACNDWFANRKGAVKGRAPSSQDLSVDPLFCDGPGADFHLQSSSPLADWPGCGRVGALGIGCESVKGRARARPRFGLAEVTSGPGNGPVRIAFTLEHAAAIEIDVFDVLGRLIASPARGEWPTGTHEVQWNGLDRAGHAAPWGVYMVRFATPAGQDHGRILRLP